MYCTTYQSYFRQLLKDTTSEMLTLGGFPLSRNFYVRTYVRKLLLALRA